MKKLFYGLFLMAGSVVPFSPQQAEAAIAPNRCLFEVYDVKCPEPKRTRLECLEAECGDSCSEVSCLLN